MGLEAYCLGRFKKGQFDITEDCRKKSESKKIISIDDGDGDEESHQVYTGDKEGLLATSAFLPEDEILKDYPHLTKCLY